jgi:hypothetical protein
MSWEERLLDLFDDLEQQAEGLALVERDAAVAELSRAEYATVDLLSRLHASIDHPVVLAVSGVGRIEATMARTGTDWVLAVAPPHEWIVRVAALAQVAGLSDRAVETRHQPVSSRVGLGSVLRSIAESRAPVVVHHIEGASVRGRLRRVGADFVELWTGEDAGRESGPEGWLVIPFGSVAAVRRS